jgi:hypothetical protein
MPDTTRTPAFPPAEPIPFDQRARRVLELKRQIREGSYRPDSRSIARAILAHWFAVGLEVEREADQSSLESADERRRAAARFVVPQSPADAATEDSLTA